MCLLDEEVQHILIKEIDMNSIIDSAVTIQTSCQSVPSTPSWFGEVVLVVQYLRRHDILTALTKRVCFARRRFGRYEVIDFLAVLFGYALSGERTLEAFYERLHPFAPAFMALFGRERTLHALSLFSRSARLRLSKPYVRCFFRIYWLVLWYQKANQQGCGIAQEINGRSSTSMGHGRRPANGHCRRRQSFLPLSVAYAHCVHLATPGASVGKSCVPGPP